MLVTEKTKQVAQQALDYIIAHPERHEQSSWVDPGVNGESAEYDPDKGGFVVLNECNTTMCVGGTVQWQQEGVISMATVGENAAHHLGLESREAGALFFETNNDEAVDMLTAIANGDAVKFNAILDTLDMSDYDDELY